MQKHLPWLTNGQQLPNPETAWGLHDPAPGLLAAGGTLDLKTLLSAYSRGTFPWFSEGQPILWWNPDPRMVLRTDEFRLHRSLRKTLMQFIRDPRCELKIDSDFPQVIATCSSKPREGQSGTWIVPTMVEAYLALHQAGHAHSVETWHDGALVGGLYCVNLGAMVFGESMFSHQSNASKIAMAGLVAFCRANAIAMIDCQQKTSHLASLGAGEIGRDAFVKHLISSVSKPPPLWQFDPLYWKQIMPDSIGRTLP